MKSARSEGLVSCHLSSAAFLLFVLASSAAYCCPYSVRQVGFVVVKPNPYHIYWFVKDGAAEERRLRALLESSRTVLDDSNVDAEVVNIVKQKAHDSTRHLQILNIEDLPAMVLVSPRDDALLLPGVARDALTESAVRSRLESVVSSPKREELREHIVKHWCVALLAEGEDATENNKARQELSAAIKEIRGAATDTGATIETPPYLLVVPHDAADEKIFLWSIGLWREGAEARSPRAAVLFGRGQRIGPVFEGDEITKESALDIFRAVGKNCGCSTDRKWLSGPSAPLRWGVSLQDEVHESTGIDPDDPTVKWEIARIWSAVEPAGARNEALLGYTEGPLGYTEGFVEYTEAPVAEPIPEQIASEDVVPPMTTEAPAPVARAVKPPPSFEERTYRALFITVGVLVVLVAAGTFVVIRRGR